MPSRGGHSSLTFLDLDGPGTLTDRLFRAIRAAILEGRVAAGERLPSTRQLATDLGLSRKVVASAYAYLGDEGYLEGRPGAGTFVGASVPDVRPIRAEPVQPERVAPRLRPSRYAARVIDLAPVAATGRARRLTATTHGLPIRRAGADRFPAADLEPARVPSRTADVAEVAGLRPHARSAGAARRHRRVSRAGPRRDDDARSDRGGERVAASARPARPAAHRRRRSGRVRGAGLSGGPAGLSGRRRGGAADRRGRAWPARGRSPERSSHPTGVRHTVAPVSVGRRPSARTPPRAVAVGVGVGRLPRRGRLRQRVPL